MNVKCPLLISDPYEVRQSQRRSVIFFSLRLNNRRIEIIHSDCIFRKMFCNIFIMLFTQHNSQKKAIWDCKSFQYLGKDCTCSKNSCFQRTIGRKIMAKRTASILQLEIVFARKKFVVKVYFDDFAMKACTGFIQLNCQNNTFARYKFFEFVQ